jgi:non-ribosomal peptide synthetase component F
MVWGLLLCFYNNKFDVVFGSVVSGRPAELEGIETMLGLFMNTIPIRVKYNENICVNDLLWDLNKNMGEGEKYHFYSLAEIQNNSDIKRDLFDHYLVFQNISTTDSDNRYGVNSKDELHNLKISQVRDYAHTNYDFGINILPGKEMTLEFKFNTFIYNKEDIELISNHFNKILNIVISDSQKRIIEIESNFVSEFDEDIKNTKVTQKIELLNKMEATSNRSDYEKETLEIWTELS